jgi:hypothetical protein
MPRDGVANLVCEFNRRGFPLRRVGPHSWQTRCPVHRNPDHSLAISRNELNHVILECRGTPSCDYMQIIRAIGFTNDQVFAETHDWLLKWVGGIPIRSALLGFPESAHKNRASQGPVEAANGAPAPTPAPELTSGADGNTSENSSIEAEALGSFPQFRAGKPFGDAARSEPSVGDAPRAHGTAIINAARSEPCPPDWSRAPDDPSSCVPQPCEVPPAFGRPLGDRYLEKLEQMSGIALLSHLASSARLLRSADGRYCAQVPVGDRLEIFKLRSAAFRDWLIAGYVMYQPEPPSSWAISRVVAMLEAQARFNAGIPDVFIRVGSTGGDSGYFLDLGDSTGQAAAIRPEGWSIVDRPGVDFARPVGMLAMPAPEHGGSIDLLRRYVNLSDAEFRLMIAWLTASLRPVGPYPILVINGEFGSGKSTLTRILRLLVDPQHGSSLILPPSARDMMATAVNGWLLVYENLSRLPGWLSDSLCQLAFGGGFASRALYTNDERCVMYAQRPVLLTGIQNFVVRGDLRDRSVFLHLAAIPPTSMRTEETFWPAFHAEYPRILGCVLDAIAGGLRELPNVNLKELPRMADYAVWGEAVARGLGWGTRTFVSTYNENRKLASEVMLEDSPVADALLQLARSGPGLTVSATELHDRLTRLAGKRIAASASWPRTTVLMARELRRLEPQLRLHGLSITFDRRNQGMFITAEMRACT